jgi:anti-sigma B factor antagonist
MADDRELITLVGEIDMTRSAELRTAVEVFRDSSATDAVVDVSDVSFFGSEGIGFLVRLFMEVQTRAGTVTLLNPSAATIRLIAITGLDDVIASRVTVTTVAHVAERAQRRALAGQDQRAVPGPRD